MRTSSLVYFIGLAFTVIMGFLLGWKGVIGFVCGMTAMCIYIFKNFRLEDRRQLEDK